MVFPLITPNLKVKFIKSSGKYTPLTDFIILVHHSRNTLGLGALHRNRTYATDSWLYMAFILALDVSILTSHPDSSPAEICVATENGHPQPTVKQILQEFFLFEESGIANNGYYAIIKICWDYLSPYYPFFPPTSFLLHLDLFFFCFSPSPTLSFFSFLPPCMPGSHSVLT